MNNDRTIWSVGSFVKARAVAGPIRAHPAPARIAAVLGFISHLVISRCPSVPSFRCGPKSISGKTAVDTGYRAVIFIAVSASEVTMNAKQFEELLAERLSIAGSEADQRMRALRTAGIVPVGARGRHAPDITAIQASLMLLSMVSRRAVDAGPVAHRASNLRGVNTPFAANTTLGAFLAALIQNPAESLMRRVLIAEDGSSAWMLPDAPNVYDEWLWIEPGEVEEIKNSGCEPSNFGRAYLGRRFVIGGGAIAQIGIEISKDMESGWHDSIEDSASDRRVLIES